jgi:hypothetical protein
VRETFFRKDFKTYKEFFHLIVIDAFLQRGRMINTKWEIQYEEKLMEEILIYSPNDEVYKVEIGKVSENDEFVFVEYNLLYEAPNGWVEV